MPVTETLAGRMPVTVHVVRGTAFYELLGRFDEQSAAAFEPILAINFQVSLCPAVLIMDDLKRVTRAGINRLALWLDRWGTRPPCLTVSGLELREQKYLGYWRTVLYCFPTPVLADAAVRGFTLDGLIREALADITDPAAYSVATTVVDDWMMLQEDLYAEDPLATSLPPELYKELAARFHGSLRALNFYMNCAGTRELFKLLTEEAVIHQETS